MTECNQSSFGFEAHFSRQVVARFDGGTITSDGGALLLRETDRRLNLLPRLAGCFLDGRNPLLVRHSVQELVSQRIYGLALGYEDLNDHEQLRQDPLMRVLAGREDVEDEDHALAGKSTLNRLELSDGTSNRYKKITFWKPALDELLVSLFLEAHLQAPEEIILDVDTTDLPLHGNQEGRFFHGYYDCYCYLPLYNSQVTDFGAWFSGLLAYTPAAYGKIDDYLKQVMPDLKDIKNPVIGKDSRSLIVQFSNGQASMSVPFEDLSDGEKCLMICALVLAGNEAYGPVLCFWDEPDNYLALDEVGHFVLALRKAFQSGGQFIATSHNPEAIRRFSDENALVLHRRNHLEPTIVRALNEIQVSGDLVGALIRGDVEP